MTAKQAAIRAECSADTIRALCAAGKIRHSRVGLGRGTIRIAEADLDAYLRSAVVSKIGDFLDAQTPDDIAFDWRAELATF